MRDRLHIFIEKGLSSIIVKKTFIIILMIFGVVGGFLAFNLKHQNSSQSKTLTGLPDGAATKTLDLSGHQLTSLPADVTSQNDIKILNLSNNQLMTLPPEIGNMTNLEEINVENNRLVDIPSEISKLVKLKRADFSNNRLTNLSPELAKMTWLNYLNLSGYDSSKPDAQSLKASLQNTDVKF